MDNFIRDATHQGATSKHLPILFRCLLFLFIFFLFISFGNRTITFRESISRFFFDICLQFIFYTMWSVLVDRLLEVPICTYSIIMWLFINLVDKPSIYIIWLYCVIHDREVLRTFNTSSKSDANTLMTYSSLENIWRIDISLVLFLLYVVVSLQECLILSS